ncbi:hypothetical protein N3K66_007093 [Trichothecium roseum]|uniref:Uncharacterized protein n=1 Tax=Trichothecium roseum TaxID=47278 RepID=A0ACC0UXV6_9HYPO|nr:hypothetical protein N3K66_007093 [Trichothecium roseum]
MAAPNTLRNVAIAGASGNIGAPILTALLAKGHHVTILSRPDSSTASFPSEAKVHRVDYTDEATLTPILRGQDVVIVAVAFHSYSVQDPLIRAAAAAGVPYFVPCEYGSDGSNAKFDSLPLAQLKKPYRQLIEELGVSSWIGVVTNPWFEYSMRQGLYGIDLAKKTATLFDRGATKASLTTLTRVGESLAALLALPEPELAQYKNKEAYFRSFHASQRDVLAAALKATGTSEGDWKIEEKPSDVAIPYYLEQLGKGNVAEGIFIIMCAAFTEGWGGDYEAKAVDYKRLGLAAEDLDAEMAKVAKEFGY